ncbi:Aspartic peptidase A1 family protein [Dioscorea alata]|uniref:Aspartic peptidase A1 family protein n=1 Tax=Dioscorea alata TaxID=55571 RepID=A0ACB7WMI6_DIOAL|nr:Aspartic peptidase A1 family protein [Dioscorea alata]
MKVFFFLLHLLLLSLLLCEVVSPLRDIAQSSCSSSKLHENYHHQITNSSGMHFTLHHPRNPCSPASLHHLPFSDVLHHDKLRVSGLTSRLTTKHHHIHHRANNLAANNPSLVSVPLSPGSSLGVGNYITMIGLGTPSSSYAMVVDTGSSLTWLQCSPCRVSCHEQSGPVFNPSSSATYRSIPCSATECSGLQSATLNPSACSTSNVCIYEASYGDSSFSVGYLSKDTLTVSSSLFTSFIYGCGQDNEGLFGKSAGLIGLAKDKLSLLSQLAPKFGNAFSYCLPTKSSTGFLSIGSYDPSHLVFTPLVKSSLDNSLYFLKLSTIKVAGKPLSVPTSSSYSDTPTIIDSGTVITRLPTDVYTALSSAVSDALSKYPSESPYSILDTCFKGSAASVVAPEVVFVFEGGAEWKLGTKNVLIDVDGGKTCLAFAPAGRVAIIGNRQQQTFKVVYDIGSSKLGFASGACG